MSEPELSSEEKGQYSAVIDTLPDTDSFLPRYLTVQLLEILAGALSGPKEIPPDVMPLVQKNEQFIAGYRNKQLFTPLTYAVFWHEDPKPIMNANPQTLDDTDLYNRAPLTIAIANEDFKLALELIHAGATLLLEDKLVLEIALISMIQRDSTVIDRILTTPSIYDLDWVKEYLDYLNSYILGEPQPHTIRYHEVLNPPLRHFGQVLDTIAYFNGLPSHYGFLSPSIEILSTHLQLYTDDVEDPNIKGLFATISRAYTSAFDTCRYYGNLPTTTEAAKILATKIANNIKSNSKEVVVLFGGWAGDSISVAFIDKIMVLSNLGMGGNPDAGTKFYNIVNQDAITEDLVDAFIRGLGNAASPIEILARLGSLVEPNPIYSLKQTFNPIDNCIFVNPRAIVQGILLALVALTKEGKVTAANLAATAGPINDMYIAYVNSLYRYSSADLAKFMRNNELLQNKRIECCALALDYINQHYKDPGAMVRCIELKNALEFVGLKDFYVTSIEPDAQAAIQAAIIKEQELTAVQVIELENSLAEKQG